MLKLKAVSTDPLTGESTIYDVDFPGQFHSTYEDVTGSHSHKIPSNQPVTRVCILSGCLDLLIDFREFSAKTNSSMKEPNSWSDYVAKLSKYA